MKTDQQYIDDLRSLKDKIKSNWTLCNLFDGTGRASEKEMMVAQTIHAAVTNLDGKPGEPFSIRGDGCFATHGNGLVDNATAYGYLCSREYFEEEDRKNKVVIFPTRKLLDKLIDFLK